MHTVGSIALALVLIYAVDGYNAGDDSTPRYVNGTLLLRSSDVTTMVSAALVVIKFFTTSWAAIAGWRCAWDLTHTKAVLSPEQVSFMTRYRLPPWLRSPFGRPRGRRSWAVVVILLSALPQPFIAPIVSGAINWNPSSIAGEQESAILVNSSSPTADDRYWSQYTDFSYATKRTDIIRMALGFASIAWSDTSTVSANGTSLRGNGCRHIVNFDGLAENSTLVNTLVPCIKIQNISWAMSAGDISDAVYYQATSYADELSVVNDTLDYYTNPGHAVVFDINNLWYKNDVETTSFPMASRVTGPQTLALIIANQYSDCKNLDPNQFGDVNNFPQYKSSYALGSCYLFANVTFTAGVTTSKLSTYISPRVIEDQTPIDQAIIEENTWTQEAVWLLPDLMTSLSQMNSTLLATWQNLDLYAENLIRQSYLAAWDSFHRTWDTKGTLSSATPPKSRVQANVSHARVYSWLAISLLETASGIFLVFLLLNPTLFEEPDLPYDTISEPMNEATDSAKDGAKELLENLFESNFF
ncbi:uncharacterized protein N7484_005348 [Penicillium longicatenatum]|uniref:uncharacterized protein n=1 Tax=Penicillium longicatenatum TaxID=1561947 RepID=UPI0025486229|nr:uncharacterized protein N7484_005348 [Penicillium longicatenatum]KAJ5651625.1 hypothetical protein N7484_005348 [Penicillium longicatenatum]